MRCSASSVPAVPSTRRCPPRPSSSRSCTRTAVRRRARKRPSSTLPSCGNRALSREAPARPGWPARIPGRRSSTAPRPLTTAPGCPRRLRGPPAAPPRRRGPWSSSGRRGRRDFRSSSSSPTPRRRGEPPPVEEDARSGGSAVRPRKRCSRTIVACSRPEASCRDAEQVEDAPLRLRSYGRGKLRGGRPAHEADDVLLGSAQRSGHRLTGSALWHEVGVPRPRPHRRYEVPRSYPSPRAQGVRLRWRARSRHGGFGMQQHAVGRLGAVVERARIRHRRRCRGPRERSDTSAVQEHEGGASPRAHRSSRFTTSASRSATG